MKLQTNYITLYTPFFPLRRWKKFYKLRPEGKYTAAKKIHKLKENVAMYRVSIQNYNFLQNTVIN